MGCGIGREAVLGGVVLGGTTVLGGAVFGGRQYWEGRYWEGGGIGRGGIRREAVLGETTVTKESGRICTFKLTEEFLNWKPLLHLYKVQREFLSVPL